MGVYSDFQTKKGIDEAALDILHDAKKIMQPCTRMDIASGLEVIASTFQINVPNEIGLEVYMKELERYPLFVLKKGVEDICREYKYPRLPLPKEFIDRCEPDYEEHRKWLMNIIYAFIDLQRFIQAGGEPPPNKYLVDYKAKK